MTTVISCVNLKGGVGKTALAVNFAAFCGRMGMRTLLVDLDPQTNATFSCIDISEWEEHSEQYGTVADLLDARRHTTAEGQARDAEDVILQDVFENVDLIPSHLDLFSIDLDLAAATARETKLRRALKPIKDDYDVIVCDCPPNLTIPTQNALACSTHYVVPISPDYLSGIGVGLLLQRVEKFCDDLGHELTPAGIVVSRVGRPALHREQTVAAMRQTFGTLVLTNTIAERVKVSESAAKHVPIFDMGDAVAATEFTQVSREILARVKATA
ncbi:MAG TPA: AAA family ATPase [Longimicrobium sp.]|nr:AAA family ATPase [Longimicrobium sp.]